MGERTYLDFKLEGNYETAVETMYIDMIHREKAPYWITVDGRELPHFLHRRKFEEAECGWYYSQSLKSVQIKYKNPKKDYQVLVSCLLYTSHQTHTIEIKDSASVYCP